jgi:hypothetical protein
VGRVSSWQLRDAPAGQQFGTHLDPPRARWIAGVGPDRPKLDRILAKQTFALVASLISILLCERRGRMSGRLGGDPMIRRIGSVATLLLVSVIGAPPGADALASSVDTTAAVVGPVFSVRDRCSGQARHELILHPDRRGGLVALVRTSQAAPGSQWQASITLTHRTGPNSSGGIGVQAPRTANGSGMWHVRVRAGWHNTTRVSVRSTSASGQACSLAVRANFG